MSFIRNGMVKQMIPGCDKNGKFLRGKFKVYCYHKDGKKRCNIFTMVRWSDPDSLAPYRVGKELNCGVYLCPKHTREHNKEYKGKPLVEVLGEFLNAGKTKSKATYKCVCGYEYGRTCKDANSPDVGDEEFIYIRGRCEKYTYSYIEFKDDGDKQVVLLGCPKCHTVQFNY